MKKMSKLAKKKANSNSTYWRTKADGEVTKYYTGQPCAICTTTHKTCGHHIVDRSLCAALRHDPRNIVALCQDHHTMGNEIAPHSTNALAQRRFTDWIEENLPRAFNLLETYGQYQGRKVDYEDEYEQWREINEDAE